MTNLSQLTPANFTTQQEKFTKYIGHEKLIYEFLRVKFGDKLCYKINKVITDTEQSFDDNINFIKLTTGTFDNKMTVITTSFSNWDVNQNEGLLDNNIVESIKTIHKNNPNKTIWIIGGAKLLLSCKPYIKEINLTTFMTEYDCDVKLDMKEYLADFNKNTEAFGRNKIFTTWVR